MPLLARPVDQASVNVLFVILATCSYADYFG